MSHVAKKSLKIENFGHLFPRNTKNTKEHHHEMRTRKGEYYKDDFSSLLGSEVQFLYAL